MLELIAGLRERGHELELACPEPPHASSDSLAARARAVGITPVWALSPPRRGQVWRDGADARRLRRWLEAGGQHLVHTWHTRDHLLGLRALPQRRGGGPRLVRSYRRAEPIPRRPWNRWLFGPGTDGLLCVSPGSASRNAALRGGRPLLGTFGAVDLERFTADLPEPLTRAGLGLLPEHRVVAVVARVQAHRRFDLLLAAMRELASADPSARLLVVGRGTRLRELAQEPARRLGIADRVIFAGYRGDDYADILRSIDLLTYLVPGSDGGCRAVLEAAASGIPAVVTARGALPELVVDGETGQVVEEAPGRLAAAWADLLAHTDQRARMGRSARRRAETRFSRAHLAKEVETLYQNILESW